MRRLVNKLKDQLTIVKPFALMENLSSDKRRAVFSVGTETLKVMVNKLVEQGFYWFLPVMLSKSTDPLWPDPGAGLEKIIELEIYGESVKTTQSMIIQKRVLVSLGPERFFVLSPNIRIEKRERARTGKHLYEFTQLDLEIAQAKMDDVFKLFEGLIKSSVTAVKKNLTKELEILERELSIPQTPFRIYKRGALEDKYGEDWEEIISEKSKDPIWVTDLPREFYDYEDELTGEWRNYDLILPEGFGEVVSGAEREYGYKKIIKKLERDGLKKIDFEPMLRLAKKGMLKPSAGAGLGVERFIAYVCGSKHVAEVQPFPRIPGLVPGF